MPPPDGDHFPGGGAVRRDLPVSAPGVGRLPLTE